jgi:hypothetical protein
VKPVMKLSRSQWDALHVIYGWEHPPKLPAHSIEALIRRGLVTEEPPPPKSYRLTARGILFHSDVMLSYYADEPFDDRVADR